MDTKKPYRKSFGKRTLFSELKVVWAISMKNLKTSTRYPVDFIFGSVIPLTVLMGFIERIFVSLTFGSTDSLFQYIGMLDYISFAVVSRLFWHHYLSVITGGKSNVRDEQLSGTLEMAYTCPVKKPILLAGFCLSDFITFLPSIIATVGSAFLIGVRANMTPLTITLTFLAFLLGIAGCFGFGFILAGLVIKHREPGILDAVLLHPLRYFSGVEYTIAVLPFPARIIAYFNPTSYAVDSVRTILLGTNSILPIAYEFLVMITLAIMLSLIGIMIFNKLERSVMKKEGIGGY